MIFIIKIYTFSFRCFQYRLSRSGFKIIDDGKTVLFLWNKSEFRNPEGNLNDYQNITSLSLKSAKFVKSVLVNQLSFGEQILCL